MRDLNPRPRACEAGNRRGQSLADAGFPVFRPNPARRRSLAPARRVTRNVTRRLGLACPDSSHLALWLAGTVGLTASSVRSEPALYSVAGDRPPGLYRGALAGHRSDPGNTR